MPKPRCLSCSILLLLGCTDYAPVPEPAAPPSVPMGVSVAPNGRTIAIGDSLQFQASTNMGTIKHFMWTVSATVASVDSTGLVHALAVGAVEVRACGKEVPTVCGSVMLAVHQ